MKNRRVCAVVVMALCFTVTAAAVGAEARPAARGVRRVWGEVKEISLTKMKLAVEVEVDEDNKETRIFLLTEDTKVRKQEHAKSLDDIKKGVGVLVFYRATPGKPDTPTAVVIRIQEGRRYGPKKH